MDREWIIEQLEQYTQQVSQLRRARNTYDAADEQTLHDIWETEGRLDKVEKWLSVLDLNEALIIRMYYFEKVHWDDLCAEFNDRCLSQPLSETGACILLEGALEHVNAYIDASNQYGE